jgi:DNA (cytosine-5)-methyltransferase 1
VPWKALDLFCGSGGAAEGLRRAGFDDITGVDIAFQPDYPFRFIQADALTIPLDDYHFVWASPPCQKHSSLRTLPGVRDKNYPDLVTPTRKMLEGSGKPYTIENVVGAPLRVCLTLCGSMFGLGTADRSAELRRHRIFEIGGFPVPPQPTCNHGGLAAHVIGVYGGAGGKGYDRGGRRAAAKIHPISEKKFTPEQCAEAMGINWMSMAGLSQAVPPAYSQYIAGNFLLSLDPAGENGEPRVFTPDRCTATIPPDTYYVALTTEQLLAEIADAIRKIDASRRDTTAEMRRKLLPAIIELRKRLRPKKQFYKALAEMGLNDSTVRSWFRRSRCADDLIDMLEPARPSPKTEPRKTREDRDGDTTEHFLRQADKLAAAVLRGNYELAARLAKEYASARKAFNSR